MPTLKVNVDGLSESDSALRKFAATILDLRGFWSKLGEALATEAQGRWPLRRRSGRLRASLVWAGGRLGKVRYLSKSSPDQACIRDHGIFYSADSISTARNTRHADP